MKHLLILAVAAALSACGAQSESGDSDAAAEMATPEARGRKAFTECAVCHTTKEGEGVRIGPNLFGVVGRKAGTYDDFAYSKAMKAADIVWSEDTLDSFIENPQKFVHGNRMAYAGQHDAQKRADIIAYLKTLK